MTRLLLVLALSSTSIAHAHEVETHVSGYGLGPFGMNLGLDMSERATFTLGVEGYYASSQAEGFASSSLAGAVIPVGIKIYLRERVVDRVVPHLRFMGVIGAGRESFEGAHHAVRYIGGFGGVGVSYFLRERLGLGTELGVGYGAQHRRDSKDRIATFTWRLTLLFRFGDDGTPV